LIIYHQFDVGRSRVTRLQSFFTPFHLLDQLVFFFPLWPPLFEKFLPNGVAARTCAPPTGLFFPLTVLCFFLSYGESPSPQVFLEESCLLIDILLFFLCRSVRVSNPTFQLPQYGDPPSLMLSRGYLSHEFIPGGPYLTNYNLLYNVRAPHSFGEIFVKLSSYYSSPPLFASIPIPGRSRPLPLLFLPYEVDPPPLFPDPLQHARECLFFPPYKPKHCSFWYFRFSKLLNTSRSPSLCLPHCSTLSVIFSPSPHFSSQ